MSGDPRKVYERAAKDFAGGRSSRAQAALHDLVRRYPTEPHVRHLLSHVLLSQGRYGEGWPLFEARHEILAAGSAKPILPFPEWRGEPLASRRLLVWPEQGAGDQIMHARFATWAVRQGAEVTLAAPPSLFHLFGSLSGVRVIEAIGDQPVEADAWVMLSSLARWAGATPETITGEPYLSATPAPAAGRVGVVVRGNPRHANDANRSLRSADAERLLALPGAVSVAPEDTGAKDFADTAAIIMGLDEVITVDTSVAHLAGALGKPVRILLPYHPDWRWGLNGERTHWYESARLHRQASPGNWRVPLAAVIA
jgi:hypothetical protein